VEVEVPTMEEEPVQVATVPLLLENLPVAEVQQSQL
jgi:hypothetical protein